MNKIKLKSRAKINLHLDIVGKREDGYHLLETIMQQIDLYDDIEITKTDSGIITNTSSEYVPDGEKNIAYKAAKILIDDFPSINGVKINIEKRIPVGAGLGGGSSNAACVLIGMNKLFNLNLSDEQLIEYGVKLGADVPFAIIGGTAIATGIGEILTKIKGLNNQWVLITKPNLSVSTKEIYENFDTSKIRKTRDLNKLVESIESQDISTMSNLMFNSLEEVTFSKYSSAKDLKQKLKELGATAVMMSGSGPTIFGFYKTFDKGKKSLEHLKKLYPQSYLIKTYTTMEE